MARTASPARRSEQFSWLITGPMALFAIICTTAFWISDPEWYRAWLPGLLIFVSYSVATVAVFNFVVRRGSFALTLNEAPLVLGLFYLPPVLMILAIVGGNLVMMLRGTYSPVKTFYNLARGAASISAALIVIEPFRPLSATSPKTWTVLFLAVVVMLIVQLSSLFGVLTLVQGLHAGRNLLRSALSSFIVPCINVTIGLLFLIALDAAAWSVVLMAVLVIALVFVLRSFAGFFRQHRTLTDVYEITQAVRNEGSDSGLPDALLGRVRELMSSEFATLWLAPRERYPEVLLTAQVDNVGLLDLSPIPGAVRDIAMQQRNAVAFGSQFPEGDHLRDKLRGARIRDAIVIPLRSGQTTIGTLEVVNRLGGGRTFRGDDVQVLETIAAHAAVAVENSRLVDRLRYDAYHDRLTAMPNRRRMLDALAESVQVRVEDEVVAVLLFDVDGQRNVNESMGHAAGDKLLAEVAERLRGIAGPGALVGRVGGDEFMVTLRTEGIETTIELATQMRERLRGPMAVGSLTLDVDTAVGVSVYPDHGADPEMLLQRAELAANAAKVLPYGVQPFHPALESRAVRRLGIAADLRRAIDADQLDVYFQPKVTLTDRHVLGVECLARWQHPTHGEVAPEDFVAVAEHTGQLARLTEVVLTAGLRHCRAWADADRPLSIAVNLSARTLLDSRFPDLVQELLEEHRVEPGQVTFEISEPGMLHDIERVLPTLYRLRDLGVRLSVDDFGTGASSLGYLRQWPVHEVKIDDTFVQGMATDSGDLAIVRAIVSLAREFGLTVVAEGVESELTLELLEEMGCEIGQGYLFSRPLPFERLEAWLSAQTEPESTPTGEVRRLRAVI